MKVQLILTFLTILSMHMIKAGEPQEFPIIADIIHTELYDATRFRDIHKAGFNACMCWCKTKEMINQAFHHASVHGIKVILFNNLIIMSLKRLYLLSRTMKPYGSIIWQTNLR